MAVGPLAVEQFEHRLRADDAVIVLELLGELQRPRDGLCVYEKPRGKRSLYDSWPKSGFITWGTLVLAKD